MYYHVKLTEAQENRLKEINEGFAEEILNDKDFLRQCFKEQIKAVVKQAIQEAFQDKAFKQRISNTVAANFEQFVGELNDSKR